MYSENKESGDSGSVGEELLAGSSELEERGRAVYKAVKEGYYDIERALRVYKLTEIEYLSYKFWKELKTLETKDKEVQFFKAISIVFDSFHGVSIHFDNVGKSMMLQLEEMTKDPKFTEALTRQ